SRPPTRLPRVSSDPIRSRKPAFQTASLGLLLSHSSDARWDHVAEPSISAAGRPLILLILARGIKAGRINVLHPRPIRGNGMKTIQALLAGLLLAGLCWPLSASAQDVPPGTYLRSCGEVYLRGDTLVATCRGVDGSAHRSSLPGVRGCVGDIGNINGRLHCNYAHAPHQTPQ